MWVSFWVAKIQIFFCGVLEIPDIFGGTTVDAGPEPTYKEKMRVPPLGAHNVKHHINR